MMATRLYEAADGYHELPTIQKQNAMGQNAVATAGGIGFIDRTTGQSMPTTTRYNGGYGFVSPTGRAANVSGAASSNGAGGIANILGGGGGGVNLDALRASTGKGAAAAGYQDAIGTSRDALSSAQGAAAKSEARITNAAGDLDAARAAAGGIGTAITNINASASRLNPYESIFAGQGNSLLSAYRALMAGDPSVGGVLGDYLGATRSAASALDAINPDNYVSMAAADVRASGAKALDAQNRELARRGVDVGSGANAALMNQFNRALAAAEASAMTRARMQGVADRANAQLQKQNLFKSVIDQANTQSDKGLASIGEASNIVQRQGDLFSVAGNLGNTQTNAYANIGGVEVNLGNLDLQNEKLVQDAYASVEAAQQAMAKFYQDTADVTETKDVSGDDVTTTRRYS